VFIFTLIGTLLPLSEQEEVEHRRVSALARLPKVDSE